MTAAFRVARRIALLSGALILACSDPVSVRTDLLVARRDGDQLELTNTSTSRVYYFAADQDGLAVADWVACTNPATCVHVAPLSTVRIALEDVALYTPDITAVAVFHWRLVAGESPTGYVADSIRMALVRLR